MLKREHCALCDNRKLSEEKGTYCRLTGEQPAFENKCEVIKFDENAKKIIASVHSKITIFEKEQTLKKAYAAIYFLVGFVLFLSILYLSINSFVWIGIIAIVGGLFSLMFFSVANHNQKKHKIDYELALEKKKVMKIIFWHYNIDYETNVRVEKIKGKYEFDYNIFFKPLEE